MTLSIMGDLCFEVQWIGLRIQTVRSCLDRCQDLGLIARLHAELDGYEKRYLEILSSLKMIEKSHPKGSLQVSLLKELLARCLAKQKINRAN